MPCTGAGLARPAREITFTTRPAANAVLYGPEPPHTGKHGHPAWKGERLGTAADIAQTATWRRTRVTRYGVTAEVDLAVVPCLWWGSLHRTPVRVILVRDLGETKPSTLALVTTDQHATGEQIVARYASRWSIEQSIKDAKNLLGAGGAHNRLPAAVERTTPLGLANLTILVLWYDHAGQPTADLNAHRRTAPWYRHKHHISIEDMITAFRRARITEATAAQATPPYSTRPSRPAKLPPRNGETSVPWFNGFQGRLPYQRCMALTCCKEAEQRPDWSHWP